MDIQKSILDTIFRIKDIQKSINGYPKLRNMLDIYNSIFWIKKNDFWISLIII